MVTRIGLFYVVGITVLFFFWAYGIVAFVRDLRRTYVPALRQYRFGRREQKERAKREAEREERERQLY